MGFEWCTGGYEVEYDAKNHASWADHLKVVLAKHGETWADVEAHTLTERELHARTPDGFGGSERAPFTLWTAKRVYFPAVYDGAEWVESVPRHPCKEKTKHVGGE